MHGRLLLGVLAIAAVIALIGGIDQASAAGARPPRGATVAKPPLLRWKPVPRARYYNVQVFRNNRKVLTRWPRRARFQLRWVWGPKGHHRRFRDGVYRWYVWPHYRKRYGRMIVRSWFRAGRAPRLVARPTIAGKAQEDALLTASSGRWRGSKPIQLSYQWQRCDSDGEACADIPGERAPSRFLTAADIDSTVRVLVTARNWLGHKTAASLPTRVVLPAAPLLVAAPRISGRPQLGQTLTADVGAWESSRPLTYTISWRICVGRRCKPASGGTERTFVLRGAALEKTVRVIILATNAGGTGVGVSRATGRIGRTLIGTRQDDRLLGSAGFDVILGRQGADLLRGGAGNDLLVGGEGQDRYEAGWGNDRIYAGGRGRDVIFCGRGRDVVYTDRRDRVHVTCEVVHRRGGGGG
jgi:RTX calcium-binding nonapeptide repeat (4 copies)